MIDSITTWHFVGARGTFGNRGTPIMRDHPPDGSLKESHNGATVEAAAWARAAESRNWQLLVRRSRRARVAPYYD